MAMEMIRVAADNIVDNNLPKAEDIGFDLEESIIRAYDTHQARSCPSLELSEINDFSRDVDIWIRGDSPTDAGVQGTSLTTAQRSTMVPTRSIVNGIWYLVAVITPFISPNNDILWRCTPSTVLNTAQILLTQISQVCGQARSRLRRLVEEQTSRDVFATAIDFALVIYAIGFLVLSLYHAYIITH